METRTWIMDGKLQAKFPTEGVDRGRVVVVGETVTGTPWTTKQLIRGAELHDELVAALKKILAVKPHKGNLDGCQCQVEAIHFIAEAVLKKAKGTPSSTDQ